jgi:cold shock CspA family protein
MPKRVDQPPPPSSPSLTGSVRSLHEKGFGFIVADDGTEYFFHRSSCDAFDLLARGTAVRFTPTDGPKGPRAEGVRRL